MRHRKSGVKLNMSSSHRQAMFRNMVTSLFKHDKIRTTDVRAKELRRWADRIITLAKRGDLHARRQALAIVREKDVVHKLFEEADKRFGKVNGGYTRITKLGRRPGDAAPVSIIELISIEEKAKKKKAKPQKQGTPAVKTATETETAEETSEPVAAADSGQPESETQKEEQEATADEAEAAADDAETTDTEAQEAAAEEAEGTTDTETDAEPEASPEETPEKKED